MADKQAEKPAGGRISESRRFNYIGFDVFPGEPKDLFSNEAERNKLIERVRTRRERHDTVRAENSLLEERITGFDRIVLTIASVAMVLALLFPFYSAFNERVEETKVQTSQQASPQPSADQTTTEPTDQATAPATVSQTTETALGTEEVITGFVPKKKFIKETSSVSGLGSFAMIGNVFSAGGILILVGVVMLLYTLLCIAVPGYVLYGLYGLKGSSDEKAVRLKVILRFAWFPLLTLLAALVLSLIGSGYGSSGASAFTSFGESYGIGVFFTTLSWGVLISLIGSIVAAVKGIEI